MNLAMLRLGVTLLLVCAGGTLRAAAIQPSNLPPGFCDEALVFFRVWDLRPPAADSPHRPDEDEDITTRTVTVAEARAMLARGEIEDLKTAYGLTLI
jgi:hypothetical protein